MADNARKTGAAVEAHFRFLLWLVPAVERFPRAQKFLLGDRIQTTALGVLECLEATYTRDRKGHLARANLGIEKLRFFFRLARQLDEIGRLIGGWARAHMVASTEPADENGQAP